MNPITINTGKVTLAFVKAPEEAIDIRLTYIQCDPDMIYVIGDKVRYICSLPTGKWKVIGDPFNPSPEFLSEILPDTFHKRRFSHWLDILKSRSIYQVNPYGEKPHETFNNPEWEYTRAKWQKAQERTGSWVVLVKEGE